MKSKKLLLIFVLICITIFFIFYYNFFILGNNINRSQDEIVDNIINKTNEYEANIDVKVISNKNENYYKMYQIVNDEKSIQIVDGPENIKGLEIENISNKLIIRNTKLNMEKIYDQYEFLLNNSLFLNVFIEDYKKNTSKIYEENDELIFEVKLDSSKSTYIKYKELHVDKISGVPRQLIIKDNTKKTCISIIYNDIKIK
ncbi:MAG TPA: hypothetical protein IAD08_08270 [Candidatus Scatovivens faecipullorum]|nr:hypothetical protein [Candidatus Scatovivens faecipullorum]